MDYAVLLDESRHTEERYRSLAAGSVPALEVVALTERLQDALPLDRYCDLKWRDRRREGSRIRAIPTIPGTADRHRFRVISQLYWKCKVRKLGVSLRELGYLRTYEPAIPINFWHCEPQHRSDRAPAREASERKGGTKVSVY